MKLSIIILSYNTKLLLKDCLSSIYKYLPKDLFEVIVLDNASTDGSVEMFHLREGFGGQANFKWLQNKENIGFGKGINQAAKSARGEYLLFLNSDAELQDDSVKEMIALAEKDEEIGVVGGKLVNRDGSTQRSYGRFYGLGQVVRMLVWGDKWEMGLIGEKSVDWVSGGFMMIRREVFEKLKGFDEGFFMYMEDMELCYRVKEAGYSVVVFPQATAFHISQGSSNRSFAIEHIYKGLLYFYKKHKTPWEYVVLKFLLIAKASILIGIGTIMRNSYLSKTYKRALFNKGPHPTLS